MLIFYNPRSSEGRKPILPLSLLALAATVPDREWALVDGNLHNPLGRILGLLDGCPPNDRPVLAVTAMPGPQLTEATAVCRALRLRRPDITVIWGGYFPTQHPKPCIHDAAVDYVLRGHADATFPQLLDAIEGRGALDTIPGLVWTDDSGAVHDNPKGALPHPRELPAPAFDRIDVEPYVRNTFLGQRTLGYHSSYGCPFLCNFCAVVNLVQGRWLPQTVEQLTEGVTEYVRRYRVDAVEFYDNNFFTSEKRVRAFAEAIEPLGISWWGEGRVDTLLKYSDETWAAMARSGLRMVFLGAESGSAETLERMQKGGTLRPEHTLQLVRRMRTYGVVPELSFVLGAPPDPEGDAEGTLRFVGEVKREHPTAEIILYLYTPEPVEGALLDGATGSGFRFPTTLDEWTGDEWRDVIQRRSTALPWMRRDLWQRVRDYERVLNAYYPTSTDTRLRGPLRWLLRSMASWRWHTGVHRYPVELAALQRLVRYQRPETSGF